MNAESEGILRTAHLFEQSVEEPNFAVYFLLKAGAVIYIGSSRCLKARIAQHRVNKVDFDEARFVARLSVISMKEEERRLIRAFAPPLNGTLHKPQPNRITIRLSSQELEGLAMAAESANRTPCGLMRFLLKKHLNLHGLS